MRFPTQPNLAKAPALAFILAAALLRLPVAQAATPYDLHDNAVQHAQQGMVLLERNQPEGAIDQYLSALKLNPDSALSASLYNNLGLAHRAARNPTLAIASFQHAIRLQPNYALYYKNLIETYALSGSLSEAQSAFEAMLSGNPDNAEALFMLGLMYREGNQPDRAREAFTQFLELAPYATLADAARSYL